MKIERRNFLATTLAGATLSTDALLKAAEKETNVELQTLDPTVWRPLGKILKAPRVGFGTGMRAWRRESDQLKLGRPHFENLFHYAYDHGIRFFDMADLYGTHEYAARTLKNRPRDSYLLATKIWFHKDGIPEEDKTDADVAVKRFLKEAGTDYLDLVQLHCMFHPDWPKRFRRQMDLLEKLKEQGLIRAHGCSCHTQKAIEAAADEPWVDVVHVRINPFQIKMDTPPESTVPAIRKAHQAGKGIIAMKLIGEGKLANDPVKRKESIAFVSGLDCVDTMIVGFEQTAEMDQMLAEVTQAGNPKR